MQYANVGYTAIYVLRGAITVAAALFAWRVFPHFKDDVIQESRLFYVENIGFLRFDLFSRS